jgi:hypothetical protein
LRPARPVRAGAMIKDGFDVLTYGRTAAVASIVTGLARITHFEAHAPCDETQEGGAGTNLDEVGISGKAEHRPAAPLA